MQEVFEKIIKKLKEIAIQEDAPIYEGDRESDNYIRCNNAIEAVEQIAAEYNSGWIPCSERLPNVSRCRVTVKYDMDVGKPIYETKDATFEKYQGGYIFKDDWMNDITTYVIAWQSLPAAYKGI